ncbi:MULTISPECIES: NUDIX hydrolase [Virgibacillus]|uniref:NUDIX hydrolase n=1 Tax=Virgibacillus TaxID=84406 RepID=UPI00038887D2|nr:MULTISPECIES: CoA pyrophosphatase [Virgibacillus]EQB38085.1 hypothetical protein M948_05800 [Virgibacillus sp. CM-4]MYL40801.1 NUDIX domain-containing protein [Virgibacillus massiliensis]
MKAPDVIAKLKDRTPTILGRENFHEFAILIPLVEINNETHLLFEVRSIHMRNQPGDICFPGGRLEQGDVDEKHGAIRETAEELGISEEQVESVIPLDYMVSDFGRIITPFVGTLRHPEEIVPNRDEVEEVFTVPLHYFLETKPAVYKVNFQVIPEDNFPYNLIQGGKKYEWRLRELDELFYQYKDKVIWGLTAKLLQHFVQLIYSEA